MLMYFVAPQWRFVHGRQADGSRADGGRHEAQAKVRGERHEARCGGSRVLWCEARGARSCNGRRGGRRVHPVLWREAQGAGHATRGAGQARLFHPERTDVPTGIIIVLDNLHHATSL